MSKPRKGSLLNLRDSAAPAAPQPAPVAPVAPAPAVARAASREGRKAMTGYFAPELSLAMRTTAMRHNMTLNGAMAEAFNDWLRKMGESPVGD